MRRLLLLAFFIVASISLTVGIALATQEAIKIGVLYPLTGGAAAEGRELRAGAELAADLANESYPEIRMDMARRAGITSLGGARIELIFKDHEGNPTVGAELAKKLILEDKVVGILGAYQSSVTRAVSAVCEQHGIPMVNDTSTSPALTERGCKWFWRTTPHDVAFTRDLFEFLKGLTEGKAKGVPPVPMGQIMTLASACERTDWGSQVSQTIESFARDYQFNLRKSLLYAAKSSDLTGEVRSLVAAQPDVLLFASYASDAVTLMRTLKAEKAEAKIVWGQDAGFEAPEFRIALGDGVVGVLTRTVFAPRLAEAKPLAGEINALYRKTVGHDLSGASARAFTGVQTWVEILQKAGSTAPAAIQAAANSITIPGEQLIVPWAGIKFATSGSEIGQNQLGSGIIGQYQREKDGHIVLEIVYPFELATADLVYPYKGFQDESPLGSSGDP